MFQQIDHIGMVVASIDEAVAFYQQAYGCRDWERISLPERMADIAVLRLPGSIVELIAPTDERAAFAKFLRERGAGLHHIAYRVENIDAALAALAERGVPLIDRVARPGIHGTRVAFVHPKAGGQGVLTELVEHPAD
jgi:methylmalonyl-CoA/ethylmalonyl-CoA epimerase